ncbi:MAG: HD domain-containing protein [Oscillospiraceae bacterium]|nr:HD domain-containing protein [Oscillospiraceae bacterium]
MLIPIITFTAIMIPFAGVIALLHNKQYSENSVRLMLTSIGCLIMNIGSFIMQTANSEPEAGVAIRFVYLGNALFYYFFLTFLLSYLRVKVPQVFLTLWATLEIGICIVHWNASAQELFIGHYYFVRNETFQVFTAQIANQSPIYRTRSIILLCLLTALLTYTIIVMARNKLTSERRNLSRLADAQFIVIGALAVDTFADLGIDIMPMLCALSLLSVVIRMMTDSFFGVTDSGHEWIFKQMENPYIITDNQYGYLDSNKHAKALFPALLRLRQNERIPDEVYMLFTASTTHFSVGEEAFERKVTELKRKNTLVGYGLLLEDDTEQQKYVRLLGTYNSRLQSEVEEKTRHIRKVQDSIITGMASVIESRDNSTGGHIRRTSTVVRIFAEKLEKDPERMEQLGLTHHFLQAVAKAAPLHDLGKIAINDMILRKPGKFTDEEYAEMKKHPAEGARVLTEILNEVDDEEFVRIAINIAHFHHERYDGKGYPSQRSGEDIPIEARIMALADVFDALVSKRCYKSAFTFDDAFRIIREGLGTQFDPVLGKLFLECRSRLEQTYSELNSDEASQPSLTCS